MSMKGIAVALVAVVLVAVAAAVYFYWTNKFPSFNYRLTVTVESGGKTYAVSTVNRVRVKIQENWTPSLIPYVTGDAIVIDVPDRPPIFVLMRAKKNVDWDASIAFHTFQDSFPKPRTVRGNVRTLAALRETREIPRDSYPTMVAFRDITRPETVYEVSPDNMSPPLDDGARVVSMTIEMTGDSATTGVVEQQLPWLVGFAPHLDGDPYATTGSGFANSLSRVDFTKRGL